MEQVGELYEKLGKEVEAVEMYRKGSCYKRGGFSKKCCYY